MTRKESREQAFILLFEYSFSGDTAEELFSLADEAGLYVEDGFCRSIVEQTIDNITEVDEIIEKYAKGWKRDRISKVTLSAIRLAVCEMLHFEDVPEAVSINEAVELIKKYATEQDASFANGILGAYSRSK